VLREVRWSATATDFSQIALAPTKATRDLLSTALQEVGVNGIGSAEDKARIYEYWSVIPGLRDLNRIKPDAPGPWGGAFLAWVVTKVGIKPPAASAAYNSWLNWGEPSPRNAAEPGMIALFSTKVVPGLTGAYLVGIVLRKRSDCIEIVTGNIVNRVVIACVALPVASYRRPAEQIATTDTKSSP
jgi:hypothetical protein